MGNVIAELAAHGPVITDGAWGTQLQARGLPIGDCPDAWNLLHPDRVQSVAQGYVDAGSQVILTNTFGANRIALERHGLADRAAEINRIGVAISRRAASTRTKVFASMGPTGKMLAAGEVSPEAVSAAFLEQARALAEGGADALVIETMSDLQEARIALEAARQTGLPVVVCMVYGAGRDGDRTIMGHTPEETTEALVASGADALGANCGNGPVQMLPICQRLRAVTHLPLWIKPNAGLPEIVEGHAVYHMTPEEFAMEAIALVQAGSSFIGGCCGTGPDFIRTLQRFLA
ncbi:MAG: homocysteine S-methyltransferase family protein [Chloroherpetonaceae bacterium]|nr:homocysteine S-methyltransferase family protein [Chthonomonadaceae bacterium]MDW8208537.1 homocysteine S-methyltransferase family protein [Chloroherpetonaceae bacterium]